MILDRAIESLVMIVVAILALDVLWQVFTRFVLNHPSSWTEELAIFLLIWVSSGPLWRWKRISSGIDYFINKLPLKDKLAVEIFVYLCIAIFSILVMVTGESSWCEPLWL